jgi:hypothetical protein
MIVIENHYFYYEIFAPMSRQVKRPGYLLALFTGSPPALTRSDDVCYLMADAAFDRSTVLKVGGHPVIGILR